MVGKAEYLQPLLTSSLQVNKAEYLGTSQIANVTFENCSDASFLIENLTNFTFHQHGDVITIPAHETRVIQVKTLKDLASFDLKFRVLNALYAPNKHPELIFNITMSE